MKICGRCDEAIAGDEAYTEYDVPSPSVGGSTVYRHVRPCQQVPTQTAPAGRW